MSSAEAIARALHAQATWGANLGSRFTQELMQAAEADFVAGGPVRGVLGDWRGDPIEDALPTRLAAVLHAAVLTGRDEALAAEYPAARADWRMTRIWPLALALLQRERAWVRDFLASPPQTNETRRSIALLPGFLAASRGAPLHLLELGASAGLNLMWDRFRYETSSWRWGGGAGPVIDTDWRGPPPAHLDAAVSVASRAGCDRNPLDVRKPEDVVRLRAFVWADQAERRARLDAVIAVAQRAHVIVERADAREWLAERLTAPLPEGVTVVFHSVAWTYFPAETKAAIENAIRAAAARADETHRIAWLRFESSWLLGIESALEDYSVVLDLWPGGERRVLARGDGHARRMIAVG